MFRDVTSYNILRTAHVIARVAREGRIALNQNQDAPLSFNNLRYIQKL